MFKAKIDNQAIPALTKLAKSEQAIETQIEDASADVYLNDVLTWIDAGYAFKNRTGNLRASIIASKFNGNAIISAGNENTLAYKNTDKSVLKAKFTNGQESRNNYAPLVEFGTRRSAPYPYLFADLENRKKHINETSSIIIKKLIKNL